MPHVVVKLYPGRSIEVKKTLADQIVESVSTALNVREQAVSVAFEEVAKKDWAEKVYRPDILDKPDTLVQKPGYNPFAVEGAREKAEEGSGLMNFVRQSAKTAGQNDSTGYFNAMSWLDLVLEDQPHMFDEFFDNPWHELTDSEKQLRAAGIRKVL